MNKNNKCIKLLPFVSETIWGGKKLISDYGVKTEKANAAEGWMLSAHKSGPSIVANGEFKGQSFDKVIEENSSMLGTNAKNSDRFPILIKFIDAMDNLSIQVHPTDEYCKKTGKGASKTECWYIIDCEEDAGLILGFKDKISKEDFVSAIESNKLTEYTEFIKVKKGDFFFIDSGTMHAICKGILLAEVQESSDTTYRIYDYGRLGKDGKPRELHVADAVNVTNLEKYTKAKLNFYGINGREMLTSCDLFTVWHIQNDDKCTLNCDESSFVSLLVLDGEGKLNCLDEVMTITKGESIFIPAGAGDFSIEGKIEILETRV